MRIFWGKISNYSERVPNGAVEQKAEAHNQCHRARATGMALRRFTAATAMRGAATLAGVGLVLLLALLIGCAPSSNSCSSMDAKADCDNDGVLNADDEFDYDPTRSCTIVASGNAANFASTTADCDNDGAPNNHATPAMADVDDDNDGLIDIYFLDDLHNIRNNLAGTSYDTDEADGAGAFGSTSGAPTSATTDCTTSSGMNADSEMIYLCGYELMRNLNFATDADYAAGAINMDWRPNMAAATSAINVGWQPLAHDTDSAQSTFQGTPFSAILEGNGNTITNLYINRASKNYVGLIGFVTTNGTVRNLGLVDAFVVGHNDVGGLAGLNFQGTISTSYSSGSVEGRGNFVGGLVGDNNGTISAGYSSGSVESRGNSVGGLVGRNNGTISDSYSSGSVSGRGDSVGGLVGQNNDTISAGYSSASVESRGDLVGGLVGNNTSTISASYSTGSVVGRIDVGGLVGNNTHIISTSYSTGSVTSTSSGEDVGGLVGDNTSIISASYSTGSVTSMSSDDAIGGLVGNNGTSGKIATSYWDTTTSLRTFGVGSDDSDNSGAVNDDETNSLGDANLGLTTAQMRAGSGIFPNFGAVSIIIGTGAFDAGLLGDFSAAWDYTATCYPRLKRWTGTGLDGVVGTNDDVYAGELLPGQGTPSTGGACSTS